MKLLIFSIFLTLILICQSSFLDPDDQIILSAIVSAFHKENSFFETPDVEQISEEYVPEVRFFAK